MMIKQILYNIFKSIHEFRLLIPTWLIGFLLLLPYIAYIDVVSLGRANYLNYLLIGFLEIVLIYGGYIIGSNQDILVKNLRS